jgi:hypothetical protein
MVIRQNLKGYEKSKSSRFSWTNFARTEAVREVYMDEKINTYYYFLQRVIQRNIN